MLSTLDTRANDPHDTLEIAPDVVLVARAAAEFPSLSPEAMRRPADRQPNIGTSAAAAMSAPEVDTTFRPTMVERPMRGKWARSALTVFLFAFTSALAAAAWQHYGDDAQQMMARFEPQLAMAKPWLLSFAPENPAAAAPPPAPAPPPQAAAADQTASTSLPVTEASAASAPPAEAAAAPAPVPADDTAQLLQSMTHDVAALSQQLEQLKASIAELKSGQDQLSREVAKTAAVRITEGRASEPPPRPRIAQPPRAASVAPPLHRPKPVYPPAQAAYVPPLAPQAAPPPVQIAPEPTQSATTQPDGDPVMRPPMPVR